MLRLTEIKLPLDHSEDDLKAAILQRLDIGADGLLSPRRAQSLLRRMKLGYAKMDFGCTTRKTSGGVNSTSALADSGLPAFGAMPAGYLAEALAPYGCCVLLR